VPQTESEREPGRRGPPAEPGFASPAWLLGSHLGWGRAAQGRPVPSELLLCRQRAAEQPGAACAALPPVCSGAPTGAGQWRRKTCCHWGAFVESFPEPLFPRFCLGASWRRFWVLETESISAQRVTPSRGRQPSHRARATRRNELADRLDEFLRPGATNDTHLGFCGVRAPRCSPPSEPLAYAPPPTRYLKSPQARSTINLIPGSGGRPSGFGKGVGKNLCLTGVRT
jgi:hypothetical protein